MLQGTADAALAGGCGVGEALEPGVRVWGRVARWAAWGALGKYRGPRCPQPAKAAAQAARTTVLTRI